MAVGDIFRGDEIGVGSAEQAVVEVLSTSGRRAFAVAALTGSAGGATAANQATEITALGGVTEAAPATDTASSGLNGRLQRIAQRITSLIALLPAALGAGGGLKIDGSGTALPIVSANPATFIPGQIALTANTRAQLPSNALVNGFILKSSPLNGANVLIGGSTVSTTADGSGNGFILEPGASAPLSVTNTNAIYLISAAAAVLSYVGN
jgi:hypothetical protein